MDWFGAGIDGPLVVIRAIHFAATAITTGTLIFRAVVVAPTTSAARPAAVLVRAKTLGVARIGLVIAAASGVIWLLLEAKSMSGLPFREAMTPDVLFTVVNETQFGLVAEVRLVVAVILAGCLAVERLPPARGLALAMSLGLIAALAWTGHAGSTLGEGRIPHLTADILHLFAAATWLGGLISLVILLSVARRDQTLAGASFARDATQGFSTLGIASVVMVFATGAVNAWILVGSLRALVGTGYGRLLMLKMMLFAVMLLIAAVNRFWLTPRLASPGGELHAVHQLTRNSVIEIVLALMIFTIVGLLGTLHPAIHLLPVR